MTKQPAKFKVRDDKGRTYSTLTNPAVVFDKKNGTLHKIGEYADMLKYFNSTQAAYQKARFPDITDDVALMVLPLDQDEIDKAFQNPSYLLTLYKNLNSN